MKRLLTLLLPLALAGTGCSLISTGDGESATPSPESGGTPAGTVVLVTHESFNLPKRLVRQFEEESGLDLEVRASGDAGELTTKLAVTSDNPIGDVAFG